MNAPVGKVSYPIVMVVILCLGIILSACKADRNKSLNELDLPPDLSEMELSADRLEIWWDDRFGVPYDEYALGHLRRKYTETTFDVRNFHFFMNVHSSTGESDLFHMLRTKPSPDLIVFDIQLLPLLIESGYLDPIHISTGYYDMDSSVIEQIRSIASDGELYAMPYGYSPSALIYNKAIFDEMEVEYPRDGMTWDEVFELAGRVADQSRWNALDVSNYDLVTSQLSLRLINPSTQQIDFESESWMKLEEFFTQLKSLQSQDREEKEKYNRMTAFANGRTAMLAGLLFDDMSNTKGLYNRATEYGLSDVDWDIVRFPVFDDGLAPAKHMLLIGVPRAGVNKDDALIAMKYLLSHEVQDGHTRKGLISLRADMAPEVFAEELDFMIGRSKRAFIHPAPVGRFDPDLDSLPVIDLKIDSSIDLPLSYPAEHAIAWIKEETTAELRQYMDIRQRLIEELKGKYGWE